jgi:regulator of replication initiation timing
MNLPELQSIADAIINANNSLILTNLLIIIFAIIGIYVIATFKKSGELTAIKLAFNDIKEQNRVITLDTESIKRQLEKGTIEYQIRLSKFHERKIDSIEKIYTSLADIYNDTRKILSSSNQNQFEQFDILIEKFRDIFESNKLWLDVPICKEIEAFAITMDTEVKKYQGALTVSKLPGLSNINVEKLYDKQEDFYDFILTESKEIKDRLESLLRSYLSP